MGNTLHWNKLIGHSSTSSSKSGSGNSPNTTVGGTGNNHNNNDNHGTYNSKDRSVHIHPNCKVLQLIDYHKLWDNFLLCAAESVALSYADTTQLLKNSFFDDSSSNSSTSKGIALTDEVKDTLVKTYIEHVKELSSHDNNSNNSNTNDDTDQSKNMKSNNTNNDHKESKVIDFIAVCSSVLFLTSNEYINLDCREEEIFKLTCLSVAEVDNDTICMNFKQKFLVAMISFEQGMALAMGNPPLVNPHDKIAEVVNDWYKAIVQIDDTSSSSSSTTTNNNSKTSSIINTARDDGDSVTFKSFALVCRDTSSPWGKLLENCSKARLQEKEDTDIQEAVDDVEEINFDGPSGGDEWLSTPAWISTAKHMLPDAMIKQAAKTRPANALELEWVHGYRGFDCRNNIGYATSDGNNVIFTAAGVTIVQNIDKRHQIYFGEHANDIVCLVMWKAPGGSNNENDDALIATGEVGKKPGIHVYALNNGSFRAIACLSGYFSGAVCQMAFSEDGKYIFGADSNYKTALYCIDETNNKQFGKMLGSAQGPKSTIYHMCSLNNLEFVSCGDKHVMQWTCHDGKTDSNKRKPKAPKFENVKFKKFSFLKKRKFLSVTSATNGSFVVGTEQGDIVLFKSDDEGVYRDQCILEEQHSKKPINAIWSSPEKGIVVTGGFDGSIQIMHQTRDQLIRLGSISLNASALNINDGARIPPIRSLCMHSDLQKVLIGTQTCQIIEISCSDINVNTEICKVHLQKINNFDTSKLCNDTLLKNESNKFISKDIVFGHYGKSSEELWGLAINPKSGSDMFATCGDDGLLRIWCISDRTLIATRQLDAPARCCAFSPEGTLLAVGFGDGRSRDKDGWFRVYRINIDSKGNNTAKKNKNDSDDDKSIPIGAFTQVYESKVSKAWIGDIKLSPDGKLLAVAAHDNNIYILSVTQSYKLKTKFAKHNSAITHIDFSQDGKTLMSNCQAYELLFSEAATGKQIRKASTLKDEKWATMTSVLTGFTLGIWEKGMDGTDINAVDRSPSGKLLATADDFGQVKLFSYPSIVEFSPSISYSGHSSHVTCCRWYSTHSNGNTDDYLITTGGQDKCIFQWKCPENNSNSNAEVVDKGNTVIDNDTDDDMDINLMGAPSGGDEFTAVKPWVGAIVAPNYKTTGIGYDTELSTFAKELKKLEQYNEENNNDLSKERRNMILNQDVESHIYENLTTTAEKVHHQVRESGLISSQAPESDDLELAWVHGFTSYPQGRNDFLNNIYYVQNSESNNFVVYPAAALGVVLDIKNRKQKFYLGHSDDISSIDVLELPDDSNGKRSYLCATGQLGKGVTAIWDPLTCATLGSIETKQKSVVQVAFTGDGRLLVTVGSDNSIVVTDWKNKRLVASNNKDNAIVQSITCTRDSNKLSILSVGEKFMKMWTINGRNMIGTKIRTSSDTAKGCVQMFYCTTLFKGRFAVGCADGSIYIFNSDDKSVKEIVMHYKGNKKSKSKQVNALVADDDNNVLLSGGKDGFIRVWTTDKLLMDQSCNIFNLDVSTLEFESHLTLNAKIINAISHRKDHNNDDYYIIFGTRGSEIVEIKYNKDSSSKSSSDDTAIITGNRPLIQGHCNDELWGLACHPKLPFFATTGDDTFLRFFDIQSRRCMASVKMGVISRAIAFGPYGNLVAVGVGGRLGRTRPGTKSKEDGAVRIYRSSPPYECFISVKDAKEWITDIKFSPDGSTLAVGSTDNCIYFYDIDVIKSNDNNSSIKDVKLKLKCKKFNKHNSRITHLDFDDKGMTVQSNCGAYELLWSDSSSGNHLSSATRTRNNKWHTWTCTLGWPVQGIWSGNQDGTDINSVCRSHSGHLLASGDDCGLVKLFRYPCAEENASSLTFHGHSSHVMNVRWSAGDEYLVSVGGGDKCILLWKHVIEENVSTTIEIKSDTDKGDVDEESEDILMAPPSGGDEAGMVKPYLGAIITPEMPPPINPSKPSEGLKLQWVHGYTSLAASVNNTRVGNNLFYNCDGHAVYPAAALGVVQSTKKGAKEQWYMDNHNDDILCLAMTPDRRFVATGQTAHATGKGYADICIWECDASDGELRLITRLEKAHRRGVSRVAFNETGDSLVSVGLDDKFTHNLWRDVGGSWSKVDLITSKASGGKCPDFLLWLKEEGDDSNTAVAKGFKFISGTADVCNFWQLNGSALTKKAGKSGKFKDKLYYCCASNCYVGSKWKLALGTHDGSLVIYDGLDIEEIRKDAHKGRISSITTNEEGQYFVTGDKDGEIKIWNSELNQCGVYNTKTSIDICRTKYTGIASLDILPSNISHPDIKDSEINKSLCLLVGTHGGEIFEIKTHPSSDSSTSSIQNSSTQNLDMKNAEHSVLMTSHVGGQLWALAIHPLNSSIVATGGDDGMVKIWDVSTQSLICATELNGCMIRSLNWHPSGCMLAAGLFKENKGNHNNRRRNKKKKSKNNKNSDSEHKAIILLSFILNVPTAASPQLSGSIQEILIEGNDNELRQARICDSQAEISQVKWSPSNEVGQSKYLAAASHDGKLYCYKAPEISMDADSFIKNNNDHNNMKVYQDFVEIFEKKYSTPYFTFNFGNAVLHLDFTHDGYYLQATSRDENLLFVHTGDAIDDTNAKPGKQAFAKGLKNYNNAILKEDGENTFWETWTLPLGWPVQGIYNRGTSGVYINSVDRHMSQKLLISGDDGGLIKLFRYPAAIEDCQASIYKGHSSHVTNVRFTASDQVVSVGGNDKCLFVWKLQEN